MNRNDSRKIYFLAIYKDKNGGYWTKFADFECLYDQGDTLEEAIENSENLIDSFLEDQVKNNCQIPSPSSLDDFLQKLDSSDGRPICIVPIVVYPPSKTIRINITGRSDVFSIIDDFARRSHISRSELMTNATLSYIQRKRQE